MDQIAYREKVLGLYREVFRSETDEDAVPSAGGVPNGDDEVDYEHVGRCMAQFYKGLSTVISSPLVSSGEYGLLLMSTPGEVELDSRLPSILPRLIVSSKN